MKLQLTAVRFLARPFLLKFASVPAWSGIGDGSPNVGWADFIAPSATATGSFSVLPLNSQTVVKNPIIVACLVILILVFTILCGLAWQLRRDRQRWGKAKAASPVPPPLEPYIPSPRRVPSLRRVALSPLRIPRILVQPPLRTASRAPRPVSQSISDSDFHSSDIRQVQRELRGFVVRNQDSDMPASPSSLGTVRAPSPPAPVADAEQSRRYGDGRRYASEYPKPDASISDLLAQGGGSSVIRSACSVIEPLADGSDTLDV
ncbi:hypothetical protein B0H17DRAFT_1184229 [Mycena rosella]|uniref:Uncharacterized protein n=1 Tax=Mycena rosella TaxID=1033263 RepID=A0AAD7G7K2_MYCRO|nr:hypothetical protein B0H17DRAFT_1184229 [Mycena rosella]